MCEEEERKKKELEKLSLEQNLCVQLSELTISHSFAKKKTIETN
jgi:hypothetical protein